jgi:hypothetical protein
MMIGMSIAAAAASSCARSLMPTKKNASTPAAAYALARASAS